MKRIPDYMKKLEDGMYAFVPPETKCFKCGHIFDSEEHISDKWDKLITVTCPMCQKTTNYPMYTETDVKQMRGLDKFDKVLVEYAKTVSKTMGADELIESLIRYTDTYNTLHYNIGSIGTLRLFELILNIVSYSEKEYPQLKKKGRDLLKKFDKDVPYWVGSLNVEPEWEEDFDEGD